MRIIPLTLAAAAASMLAYVETASACGGTFCDIGPLVSPVDQAAETVLFIQDGAFVEAHIQIAIDPNTEAQKFAWLVPMLAVPEFSVGSQPLFDALLAGTSPVYTSEGRACNYDGGVAFISEPDGGGAGKEPNVHTETVGAFEVTTLEGGTVDTVMAWLGDNGYAQDPAAEPILADYIDAGHVLVAFKLIPNADIAEVHPVVLRYEGDEPCVPIKLTAIAAQPDMGVRAFFLGETRFAPTNYRHVVMNELRFDWNGNNSAYAGSITMAVDEAPAGHAFVTEYAGASDVILPDGIYAETWNAAPFATAEPIDVVDLLNAQGLAQCVRGSCIVPHPLIVAMLRKYLPAPEDVSENNFYSCLSCYEDTEDFADWDGPAFAVELDQRVIDPGRHGRDLLAAWPYLTRMFTTISAHEMTVDPTFHANAELPEVPLPSAATRQCVCEDDAEFDSIVTLPDRRAVYNDGADWPQFTADMPYAERIEQIPPVGAPLVEQDNRAAIDALLAAHNGQFECMPNGSGSGSGSDTGAGTSDVTASDGPGTADGSGGTSEGGGGDQDLLDAKGCGCTADDDAPTWLLLAGVWLGYARRRRVEKPSATNKSTAAPGLRGSELHPQPRSRSNGS